MPLSGAHVCLYADGTNVTEEFFQTLPNNTELVLLSRDQAWSGGGESYTIFQKKERRRTLVVVYVFLTTLTVSVNLDSVCCPTIIKKNLCL